MKNACTFQNPILNAIKFVQFSRSGMLYIPTAVESPPERVRGSQQQFCAEPKGFEAWLQLQLPGVTTVKSKWGEGYLRRNAGQVAYKMPEEELDIDSKFQVEFLAKNYGHPHGPLTINLSFSSFNPTTIVDQWVWMDDNDSSSRNGQVQIKIFAGAKLLRASTSMKDVTADAARKIVKQMGLPHDKPTHEGAEEINYESPERVDEMIQGLGLIRNQPASSVEFRSANSASGRYFRGPVLKLSYRTSFTRDGIVQDVPPIIGNFIQGAAELHPETFPFH
jgi:hypothetical protein